MADARVDIAIAHWMIEKRLDAATLSTVRHMGEEETDGAEIVARASTISFRGRPRHKSTQGETDVWDLELTVELAIHNPDNYGAAAISQAASEIVHLFDEYSTTTDPAGVASDHELTFERATVSMPPHASDLAPQRLATVRIPGYVQRNSGTSRTTAFIS